MKMREWQKLFSEQARLGKSLFTVTELANASGAPRPVVAVEMARLVKYGVVARYAQGLYGLAGTVVPAEKLLHSRDPHAYITGAYALMQHGLITQVPTVITAFSSHRHTRREIPTPAGRIEFVCVKPPVYRREVMSMAGPELALCDFVYLARRRGMDPAALATFRRLKKLRRAVLARAAKRYPSTVKRCVSALVSRHDGGRH